MSKKLLKFYILFFLLFLFIGCEKKEVKEEQSKEIKK